MRMRVVDRACQELEGELRKLQPEGGRITQGTFTYAVLALNSKLRRKINMSAYEIHTAHSLDSGNNFSLTDNLIREEQIC